VLRRVLRGCRCVVEQLTTPLNARLNVLPWQAHQGSGAAWEDGLDTGIALQLWQVFTSAIHSLLDDCSGEAAGTPAAHTCVESMALALHSLIAAEPWLHAALQAVVEAAAETALSAFEAFAGRALQQQQATYPELALHRLRSQTQKACHAATASAVAHGVASSPTA
jgi:hypothetical protein